MFDGSFVNKKIARIVRMYDNKCDMFDESFVNEENSMTYQSTC